MKYEDKIQQILRDAVSAIAIAGQQAGHSTGNLAAIEDISSHLVIFRNQTTGQEVACTREMVKTIAMNEPSLVASACARALHQAPQGPWELHQQAPIGLLTENPGINETHTEEPNG